MSGLVLVLSLAAGPVLVGPGAAEAESGGVRLRTSVSADVYTFELTNVGREPIIRCEIPFTNGYNYQVPEGWKHAADHDRLETGPTTVFRAWAPDTRYALGPGQTGRLSCRVTSKATAVLGGVAVRVELASGESVMLEDVWAAVPAPRGQIVLVAGVVLALCALHTLVLTRNDRRSGRAATGP